MGLLDGKVAIVTCEPLPWSGRAHCLALAEAGATVVVNDLGSGDCTANKLGEPPPTRSPPRSIKLGGRAHRRGPQLGRGLAGRLRRWWAHAVAAFGRLDIVVNNAGMVRDRMIFTMSEAEWDAVIGVHLKGPAHVRMHGAYWRDSFEGAARPVAERSSTPRPRRACSATPVRRTTGPPRPASPASRYHRPGDAADTGYRQRHLPDRAPR